MATYSCGGESICEGSILYFEVTTAAWQATPAKVYAFKHQLDLFSFIRNDLPTARLIVSVVVAAENDFSIPCINNLLLLGTRWIVNKTVNI